MRNSKKGRFHLWPLRLFFILAVFLLSDPIWAKAIQLSWDPIEDADKYELVIERGGKPVSSVILNQTEWSGELSNGFHAYRIRAIDALGRPGEWSEPNPIVVMPEPPMLMNPKKGESIELFTGQEVELAWSKVEGFSEHWVELKSQGKEVYTSTVLNNNLRLGELPAGDYLWSVRGEVLADPGYSTLSDRKWMSEFSETGSFSIVRRTLSKPVLLYPVGEIWPSNDGRMEFKWTNVPGALAYEIRISEILTQDQVAIGVKPKEKVFRTEETSISVSIGDHGHFVWAVRALPSASLTSGVVKLSSRSMDSTWSESQADFSIQYSALSIAPQWELSSEVGYSGLSFDSIDTQQNYHGTVSPKGIPFRLGVQKWWSDNWGLDTNVASTFYNIENSSNSRTRAQMAGQYQRNLGFGWFGSVKLGFQLDQTPFLAPLPGGSGASITNQSLLGTTAGLQITKLIGRRVMGVLEGRAFHPIRFISGDSNATLAGNSILPNGLFRGSVLISRSKRVGYQFGVSWEMSSIHWSVPGSAFSNRESTFAAACIFGGVFYRLGEN